MKKNFGPLFSHPFVIAGILLLATNLAIAMDLIIARQVLIVISFFVLPGLLILNVLKVNGIGFVKKAVLSTALSISFLIFAGLSINLILPRFGVTRPLSTVPLLLSLDLILLSLFLFASTRREKILVVRNPLQVKLAAKEFFNPFVLVAFIFPFFMVGAVTFMNVYNNNALILVLFLSILIYVSMVVRFSDKVPKATYPLAVILIAISLLLILPLRDGFIIAGDGPTEYLAYLTAVSSMYWNPGSSNYISACLGGALLNTICYSLFNTSIEWTFKLVTPLVFSLAYLSSYELFKGQLGERNAFLCSIFFVFQALFVGAGTGSIRVIFGLLFVILAITVLFDETLRGPQKSVLFLVFLFSLVVTYYSYAYIFLIFLLLSWFIAKFLRSKSTSKISGGISVATIVLAGAAIFLWYGLITINAGNFPSLIEFFRNFFDSATSVANLGVRDQFSQQTFGLELTSQADNINRIVYYIPVGLMALGSVNLLIKRNNSRFDLPMILSFLLIWLVAIVSPYVTTSALGMDRIFYLTLIIMAPMLVIGAATLIQIVTFVMEKVTPSGSRGTSKNHSSRSAEPAYDRGVKRNRFISLILLGIIVSQLVVNVGLTYQVFGNPRMVLINSSGTQFDSWVVHPQETEAGTWLFTKGLNYDIYTDSYSASRLAVASKGAVYKGVNIQFFKALYVYNDTTALTQQNHSYLYLRYQNVVEGSVSVGLIRKTDMPNIPLEDFSYALAGQSKIYDNGGSQVLFK